MEQTWEWYGLGISMWEGVSYRISQDKQSYAMKKRHNGMHKKPS
jgi:hypothetical protein